MKSACYFRATLWLGQYRWLAEAVHVRLDIQCVDMGQNKTGRSGRYIPIFLLHLYMSL